MKKKRRIKKSVKKFVLLFFFVFTLAIMAFCIFKTTTAIVPFEIPLVLWIIRVVIDFLASKQKIKFEPINALNLPISEAKKIIEKSESSVCEIKTNNGYGTGFICSLKFICIIKSIKQFS